MEKANRIEIKLVTRLIYGFSAEPQPGPSGTQPQAAGSSQPAQDEFSALLGINVSELPEGVDPSFLVALPEEMRHEVIEEQRRLQEIRRRAQEQQNQNATQGVTQVNAEFLAALPPNIQEEVLAQQRMEQQRQAATATNPDEPVDPGEFLGTLPGMVTHSHLILFFISRSFQGHR